jgi:hypothetical protein
VTPEQSSTPAPRSNTYANLALICGVVSLVSCWMVVPSVLAITFGLVGNKRSGPDWDNLGGRRARMGIALGVFSLVALAIGYFIVQSAINED